MLPAGLAVPAAMSQGIRGGGGFGARPGSDALARRWGWGVPWDRARLPTRCHRGYSRCLSWLVRSQAELHPWLQAATYPYPKIQLLGAAGFLPRGSFAVLFYTFQVLLGKYVWQRVLCAEQPRALCRPRERGDPYSLDQIAVLSRSPAIRYSASGLPSHLPAPRTH